MALKAEFGKLDPPPSDKEALQERLKLDYAIHDFEWSMNEMGSFRPGETAYPLPQAANCAACICKRQRHFGKEGGVVRGTLARCGIRFSV